jgi:hypothetical protein
MHKDSTARWKVIVDDMVHDRDIQPSCRDVGDDEQICLAVAKESKLTLPGHLIQRSVYVRCGVTRGFKEIIHVLDVMFGGYENDGLIAFSGSIETCGGLEDVVEYDE